MSPEIVGREDELASLRAFFEQAEGGLRALVLQGEPGIGKSTLWLAGVEEAWRRDLRVLSSRPVEAERGLAHAGLGDLFEGVLGDVLPTLAPPRRHALEVALLVEEAHDEPVDHRALAVAVRDVLDVLSDREPVVVAVDDVQWLDPSSARALAFALRRLGEKNVCVLLARRLVAGAEATAGQILISQRLHAEVEDDVEVEAAGEFTLKGFGRPVPAFNVVAVREAAAA